VVGASTQVHCCRPALFSHRPGAQQYHMKAAPLFGAVGDRASVCAQRGGYVIYCGPLGKNSQCLVDYFEARPDMMHCCALADGQQWALGCKRGLLIAIKARGGLAVLVTSILAWVGRGAGPGAPAGPPDAAGCGAGDARGASAAAGRQPGHLDAGGVDARGRAAPGPRLCGRVPQERAVHVRRSLRAPSKLLAWSRCGA